MKTLLCLVLLVVLLLIAPHVSCLLFYNQTETVTVSESFKDLFGFAIKTESGKYIQIRGGSEACYLGLVPGTRVVVPVSDKNIYSARMRDIDI